MHILLQGVYHQQLSRKVKFLGEIIVPYFLNLIVRY